MNILKSYISIIILGFHFFLLSYSVLLCDIWECLYNRENENFPERKIERQKGREGEAEEQEEEEVYSLNLPR